MARPMTNYIVDMLMFLAFLIVSITGIVRFFGINLFGLKAYTLRIVHDYTGFALIALALLHLILHWSWIIAMSKNIFRRSPKKEEQ